MKLGPFQEVILESSSVEELKEKVRLNLVIIGFKSLIKGVNCSLSSFHLQLSEMSDIPLEHLEFAKVCASLSTKRLPRHFLSTPDFQ